MFPAPANEALELPSDTAKVLTNPKSADAAPASAAPPNLRQSEPAQASQLAPNEPSITLYAELLLHIRAVTLFASLRTFHTHETKAQLSADGSSITVSHEGESATVRLPVKVQGGGDAVLSLPAQPPGKDLTLRLQIEEKEGTSFLGGVRTEDRVANIVPWDGASLNAMKNAGIVCRICNGVLVRSGKVGEWRDLPNENWAEMMDFWHCHKPDEHQLHDHTHETAVGKKGYAAGNRLKAIEGVGFVDLASFLLREQDCEGAEVGDISSAYLYRLFLSSFHWTSFREAFPGPKKAVLALSMATSSIQAPKSNRLHYKLIACVRILFPRLMGLSVLSSERPDHFTAFTSGYWDWQD